MTVKVYINGEIAGPDAAMISVFDRGFLYGDSVYEVMRTSGGRPVDLDRHVGRLRRSGGAIALDMPADSEIREAVGKTLDATRNDESYVRVVVTRGAGEIGLDIALAERPSTIVIVRPLKLPSAEQYERGIHIQIVGVQRTSRRAIDPNVKSGNYLNSILALAEARAAGADEAIMCDAEGRIAEGASSNLFAVCAGEVVTPALDIGLLAGITRGRVIELARGDGLTVREAELDPKDVRGADEVFITSSIRGILPVRRVDDAQVRGAPGPVTRRLMDLYAAFLSDAARS